jgi:hypothetical protein
VGEGVDTTESHRQSEWRIVSVGYLHLGHIKMVRVSPGQPFVDLTPGDFKKGRKQKSFLKRGTRGTGIEFKDLGLAYLPIPPVD